ncbi:MAG: hypothetical protein WD358_00625 [Nitriliruptoraceae bacterium]
MNDRHGQSQCNTLLPDAGPPSRSLTVLRSRGAMVVMALAGIAMTGCTSELAVTPPAIVEPVEEPTPAPVGVRIGVVLPPADAWHPDIIDEMRRDLAVVRATAREGVHELASYVPDSEMFIGDLVGYLAAAGFDITCALTTGSSSAVRQQHANLPQQRFCALVTATLPTEEAPGFDLMVLRTAEFGHVVGVAAAAASEEAVGYVLAPHDLEQGRFRDGLLAALATTNVVDVDPELDGVAAAVSAMEQGADVVVIGGGPWAVEAAEAAIARGARVVVPDAIARRLDDDAVVATWRIQWHRVLRGPVDRLLEREAVVPLTQGVAEGVLVMRFGGDVPFGVNAQVNRAIRELSEGVRGPLDPRSSPLGPGSDLNE